LLGYWQQPGVSAEAIDSAGWMHTGDLATMDEAGYVRIVGRSKDMIIRGGENVYPREIEEFLYTYPGVADVQVVGIPDERYGEDIVAFVRPETGTQLDEDALREHCRERIAHYKVPRHVRFVAEFPMTVTGKVQKFKLRQQAIAELSREHDSAT
jgi:fatty-acyl-CoA synthase